MWARTTLREVLNASISMCRGNGHHSSQSSLASVELLQAAVDLSLSHPLAAQGPPTWRCWRRCRTRSQCAPPTTPTRWPGSAWPRLQRTLVNVGPKSSNRVAATEVNSPFGPDPSNTWLGTPPDQPLAFLFVRNQTRLSLIPVWAVITADRCGAVLSGCLAVQGQRSRVQRCFIYTQAAIQ